MKRASLLAPIAALALTLPVFAQADRDVKTGGTGLETTLKLMINGGVDCALCYEGEVLREVGRWSDGGIRPGSADTEPYYFFNGPVWVQFWASLQDNVELVITIRNIPFENSDSFQDDNVGGAPGAAANNITDRRNWGAASNMQVTVKYAYIRIKELFDQAWSLSMGEMDFGWDLRGRGNSIFMDVAHSESPWGEISRAWATTVRNEEYPVGFKVNYHRDQFDAELGLVPVVHEAQARFGAISNQSQQEAIYYLNGVYKIDNLGSKAGAIFALFHGVHPSDNVYTFGGGVVFVPQQDIELFAEGYYQWGQSWTGKAAGPADRAPLGGNPARFIEDGDHTAWMFLLGGRVDVPGSTAYFAELHFLYISGHDMENGTTTFSNSHGFGIGGSTNDESKEFMSYENYDVMAILNSNEWGFDLDNNIMQIDVQGGVMLSTGGAMQNNLHLILKIAWAQAVEEWQLDGSAAPLQVRAADDPRELGFEVDFTVRWFMNKNANIYWTVAYLGGSEIVEAFNNEGDEFSWLWLLGFQVTN